MLSSPLDMNTQIAIVGAGMVGGTLACALADGGLHVLLIDRDDPADMVAPAFDGRASAVAQASQQMLKQIGVWRPTEDMVAPILDIRVADGSSRLFLHYDHSELGDSPLGYMVENRHLRRLILDRVRSHPNITFLAPANVIASEIETGGVTLELDDDRQATAQLLIGADGRRSPVRDGAGIGLRRWAYDQTGIVCTVAHEKSHHNVAHEHFLPAGPFAILPLTGNRASIVWTERAAHAPAVLAMDDDDFTAALARRFGDFLGDLSLEGPRWSYPLSLQMASTSVAERTVLVGDAAHAIHPIAGQGLNMGFRDVAALAEVLVDGHRLGLDLGSAQLLARYEQWRRFDNHLMAGLTDALNRLFSNDLPPLRRARDLGLAAVNHAGPLKKVFMRHAMGLAGDPPRLLRGEAL